jgi:hypothetical protein
LHAAATIAAAAVAGSSNAWLDKEEQVVPCLQLLRVALQRYHQQGQMLPGSPVTAEVNPKP